MEVKFSKYSGCGNDFIFIDNRKSFFPKGNRDLIFKLCHRPQGIGADGVILLEESKQADFRMSIFNADGSEAEMCGNGLRCLKKFIAELGIQTPALSIETKERQLSIQDHHEAVKISLGKPQNIQLDVSLDIGDTLHTIDTGVPHAVQFVDKLEEVPVAVLGKKIRWHPFFSPKGTNANFVKLEAPSQIAIRTYERGVEQETLACGTGAAAAALISFLVHKVKPPIEVITRSGEKLMIDVACDESGAIKEVWQIGPASFHFQGTFVL